MPLLTIWLIKKVSPLTASSGTMARKVETAIQLTCALPLKTSKARQPYLLRIQTLAEVNKLKTPYIKTLQPEGFLFYKAANNGVI